MDMTKQYRAELRDLKRNKSKLSRDYKAVQRDVRKRTAELERYQRHAARNFVKAAFHINKRIAILEGRLS